MDDEVDDTDELGGYVIYFGDDGSRACASPELQQMLASQTTTKETRDFIRDKMRSAVDLLRNIEHRRQTMLQSRRINRHAAEGFLNPGVQFTSR